MASEDIKQVYADAMTAFVNENLASSIELFTRGLKEEPENKMARCPSTSRLETFVCVSRGPLSGSSGLDHSHDDRSEEHERQNGERYVQAHLQLHRFLLFACSALTLSAIAYA